MPGQIANSKKILRWIKDNTPNAMASVMFQYQPYFDAENHPEISRKIDREEYNEICRYAVEIALNGWIQDFTPQENLAGTHFKPGFDNIH